MIGMWAKNKRFFTLPASVALVFSICLATSAGAEKKQDEKPTTRQATTKPAKPGFETGCFQKVSDRIGGLLKLNWKDENLRLDNEHWNKDLAGKSRSEVQKMLMAEMQKYKHRTSRQWQADLARRTAGYPPPEIAFMRVRIAAGHLTRAGSGSGQSGRKNSFATRKLKGKLHYACGPFKVMLEEIHPPHRTIDFRDDGGGVFDLVLFNKSGKLSLMIKQGVKGEFHVKHVAGGNVFTGEEKSFKTFYARHRRYVDERMFPLLKHVGIGTPLTLCSAEVKKATLARLRNLPTPEKTAQGQKLIEQLNDNSYKKRQEASKALAADFESYRSLIARTIMQSSTPPETASRLKTIVKSNPKQNQIDEFVTTQELVSNVDYLIDLIVGKASESDRAVVAKALQRLTKQKFGPDPAKWKKWRSGRKTGTNSK